MSVAKIPLHSTFIKPPKMNFAKSIVLQVQFGQ